MGLEPSSQLIDKLKSAGAFQNVNHTLFLRDQIMTNTDHRINWLTAVLDLKPNPVCYIWYGKRSDKSFDEKKAQFKEFFRLGIRPTIDILISCCNFSDVEDEVIYFLMWFITMHNPLDPTDLLVQPTDLLAQDPRNLAQPIHYNKILCAVFRKFGAKIVTTFIETGVHITDLLPFIQSDQKASEKIKLVTAIITHDPDMRIPFNDQANVFQRAIHCESIELLEMLMSIGARPIMSPFILRQAVDVTTDMAFQSEFYERFESCLVEDISSV